MTQRRYEFPKNFLWGAATASYQVEGAIDADGRKPSVWDTFCQKPGAIKDGSSGKDACRHFEKLEEDLDLMKSLNLGTYRFSIAWPRIIPDGRGKVNAKGFDFYDRLVDGLLKRGIKPNATLYHWDLPQPLEDAGGWQNRDTAYAYADYAAEVVKHLGDRVDFWATFNEPGVFVWCGYQAGVHAPGLKVSDKAANQIIHHVLLGHGLGMQAIRSAATKPGYQAGIVLASSGVWPASRSHQDIQAANWAFEDANDWWVLPMLNGKYPDGSWKRSGDDVPQVQDGDMRIIQQPIDFMGVNYYFPNRIAADPENPNGYKSVRGPATSPRTAMDWEVFPAGIESVLTEFSRRYPKIPLYITENGTSIHPEQQLENGKLDDPERLAYIRDHLIHCHRAIAKGVDLRGYYAWSLMDNFEWGWGYLQRFGIVHVDYSSYARTVKESGKWYAQAAASQGFDGPELPHILNPFEG